MKHTQSLYPLPEAYRDAAYIQIQIWLDEGVIERSASHTRFEHPLLLVMKKKDANSHYDMPKSHVVVDVRKLASIFENIGMKAIHSCLDIHACFLFGFDVAFSIVNSIVLSLDSGPWIIAMLKDALTKVLVMSPGYSARFRLATVARLTAIGRMLYQVIDDEIRCVGLMFRWDNIFSCSFDFVHLAGVSNVIPDALSRPGEDDDAFACHLLGGRYCADGDEKLKKKRKMGCKLKTPAPSL
ncbi:hypothetical protein MAM1_0876d11324 [Mucor ambiguus]|uniref:Reverse transcriptase domain-containing protein n=1 Tax=Mucor ambiguus TaxID=91626 RepID=A0A0C9MWK0_9FUNG|nr:hypothetical protein MAM1_0876d11324 [Mucor ambiguus]